MVTKIRNQESVVSNQKEKKGKENKVKSVKEEIKVVDPTSFRFASLKLRGASKKLETKNADSKKPEDVKELHKVAQNKEKKELVKKDVIKKIEKIAKSSKSNFSIDLIKLLQAGVHFGHQSKRWHPKMAPYIWKNKDGVHIFDLIKTSECLVKACEAVKQLVSEGKTIVFVGTKRQAAPIVRAEAERAGVPFIVARWAGGTISNWQQVKLSINRLKEIEEGLQTGKFNKYTKKERVMMEKEMSRLKRLFGGIVSLTKTPDALFIIDINREKAAVREANKYGIKLFAIVDTNVNPTKIDFPIPGNDDAVRSITLLVETFANAILEGKTLKK